MASGVVASGVPSAWLQTNASARARYSIEKALPAHVGTSLDAYDERLHRRVVLRVYGPEDQPERALAGARAASRVKHPGVVEVHDAGELGTPDAPSVYVAVERIGPSQSLRAWVDERPTRGEVREVFDALAQAVQAVHETGVVHGGLDGTAVRVCRDGRVLLAEFRGGDGTPLDDQRALARLWLRATARWRNPQREAALRRAVDPVQRNPFESVETLRRAVADTDRRRLWPWGIAASVVAACGAAWWVDSAPGDRPPCERGVDDEAARTWSPERAESVRRGLLRSGSLQAEQSFERIEPRIDDYIARWRMAAASVCSAGPSDPRVACYATVRAEVHSVLALLEGADRRLADRAVQTVLRLPELARCEGTRLPGGGVEFSVDEGRLNALRRTGRDRQAYTLATRLLADPERTDAQRGTLHLARCYARFHERKYEDAVAECEAAYGLAESSESPRDAVVAATLMVSVFGFSWHDEERARVWLKRARHVAERTGADGLLVAEVDKSASKLAYARGDYAEALTLIDRAIETGSAARGQEHPAVWGMRINRAALLRSMMRVDDALAETYALLSYQTSALGTMNPVVGQTYNNLGTALSEDGRPSEALESFDRAIEIWTASKGPDYPDLGMALTNRGRALVQLDQPKEGLPDMQAAVDVWTRSFGPDNFRVAIARNNLSAIYAVLDRFEESAVEAEAAYDIQVANAGPMHPDNVYPLTNLADSLTNLGRLDEAERWANEAMRITEGRAKEIPLEHAKSRLIAAETRLAKARASPEDADLRALAVGEMRAACRLTDTLPSTEESARCHVHLATALWAFESAEAEAVARMAIERIDDNEATRAMYADHRARLLRRLGELAPEPGKDPP